MSGTEDKFPAELSGGMRKRISLARALMMDPELILFDEPSAGLDPVAKSGIDELIIDLTEKKNVTSVIVTHEMDNAFHARAVAGEAAPTPTNISTKSTEITQRDLEEAIEKVVAGPERKSRRLNDEEPRAAACC